MNNGTFLRLNAVVPRVPDCNFAEAFDFEIRYGQCWTFYGPNGSGKTLLSEVICGKYGCAHGSVEYPFLNALETTQKGALYARQFIRTVSFQSTYTLANFRESYYQQRFQSQDAELSPTVEELFLRDADAAAVGQVVGLMQLQPLLQQRLVSLSSGQLRRLLIAGALLKRPKMLVFDNPFVGLDVASRDSLNALFERLMAEGIPLLILVPTLRDIPSCTTHILHLEACHPVYCGPISGFRHTEPVLPDKQVQFPTGTPSPEMGKYENVLDMRHLDIRYGDRFIQRDLSWTVRKGEKWALLGPNGSGKSTLLSYVFADNPQAYALPIWLFDRKRGSGESIWDIKKRIGYTSSEMHLYYLENIPCLSVIQSGFFDSVGLFRKCSDEQTRLAQAWLDVVGLRSLEQRSFLKISSGEQRMLLFVRSLVKNPELLILDEPFHGMDTSNKQLCQQLINRFAEQRQRSMIFVTHYREEIPHTVNHTFELSAL
ncbi:MAG: ATP-binding cassette domain-containing protein [Paludibacteraceae bacterium]|nr:ATP-binding cassette domain-containing protein [Paludibacteraceae bacterium]